ncbi:unnamed protein product [Fusarium graminearum]|uniref:Chromosome 3, complete genome n=1 Tax=Gibberella zeae (strain ATCC MYA-4620 / CBS 123657 / FGSC 9075 / NRRL 31084 / PH-1) TaxID=229533 RepID=A0A0E0SI63_GIBZE|nr:hypothetical protein FG05_35189 [Fusarium graminearum]CEF86126.1 unnamed protein product [Fusarium graminearum]
MNIKFGSPHCTLCYRVSFSSSDMPDLVNTKMLTHPERV